MSEDPTRAMPMPGAPAREVPAYGRVGPADPHADPATHPALRPADVDGPATDPGIPAVRVGPPEAPTVPTAHQPGKPEPAVRHSRSGGLWTGLILSAIVLIFLLVFILQNQISVTIRFLGFARRGAGRRGAAAGRDRRPAARGDPGRRAHDAAAPGARVGPRAGDAAGRGQAAADRRTGAALRLRHHALRHHPPRARGHVRVGRRRRAGAAPPRRGRGGVPQRHRRRRRPGRGRRPLRLAGRQLRGGAAVPVRPRHDRARRASGPPTSRGRGRTSARSSRWRRRCSRVDAAYERDGTVWFRGRGPRRARRAERGRSGRAGRRVRARHARHSPRTSRSGGGRARARWRGRARGGRGGRAGTPNARRWP